MTYQKRNKKEKKNVANKPDSNDKLTTPCKGSI